MSDQEVANEVPMLNNLIDSWFEYQREISELNAEAKILREGKAAIQTQIIEKMESKCINSHSSGSGTLNLVRKTKKPTTASKKKLKIILEEAQEGAIDVANPLEAFDYIFGTFEEEEVVSLQAAKSDLP